METDRRAVLAILNDAKKKAYQQKQTVDWTAIEREWDKYFEQFSGEQWRNEFMPLFEGVAEDQAENWSGAFGIQFDIRNPFVQPFLQDYAMTFSEPILDTTQKDLLEMLRQADVNGWSVDEMVKQIDLTWERYLDPTFTLDGRRLTDDELQWFIDRSPRYRKSLIARDQAMRVSNASSFALFTGFGAPMKEWLHSGDDRVRPEHRATGNAYIEGGSIGPIPIDEPFQVPPGSSNLMMYPGDSSLGAPIHLFISDRCALLPFLPEEETPGTAETIEEQQERIEEMPRFEQIEEQLIDEIREAQPDFTLDDITEIIDLMSLNREAFIEHARQLGIPNPEALADLFFDSRRLEGIE